MAASAQEAMAADSPASASGSIQAIITIDRTEQKYSRRYEIYTRRWWRERLFTPPVTNGRTVYRIDFDSGVATPLFDLPQLLDPAILKAAYNNQPWHRKVVTRGLRTIVPHGDGYVICDVFGIYDVDATGKVLRYLTTPEFSDLHSVFPNEDNSRLLVTTTGLEQVQEIGWDGTVFDRISFPELYGIGFAKSLVAERAKQSDLRIMQVEMSRHLFHVNWAEYLDAGHTRMLVSLYVPGIVAILTRKRDGGWEIERTWSYFPKCHCPTIDFERNSFIVAISGTDQAVEVDMESGKILWIADNIRFGKSAVILDSRRALLGDCNGRRLVEIDRETGAEIRSISLPGIPYGVYLNPSPA
jgi:hypothetical protein